jgi:hypothetical protein
MEANGIKVPVKRGIRLRFEFSDPGGLLATRDNPGGRGAIDAGLWLPSGEYIPMRPVKAVSAVRTFEVTVPVQTSLRVQVTRAGVRFEQEAPFADQDRIPYLDNPVGFGLFSGDRSRTLRFVLRPTS